MTQIVHVVDYGMGNLASVAHALEFLGAHPIITHRAADLDAAQAIILPGVGAFGEAMHRLASAGFTAKLHARAIDAKIPILGICLGMQLMARQSAEGGLYRGLGWLDAHVERFDPRSDLPVPHVGWNQVEVTSRGRLFARFTDGWEFYFDHSYQMVDCIADAVTAYVDYGGPVVAAIERGNIMGVQFHPEKSQTAGLRLLRNFLNATAAFARGESCAA